MRAPTSLLGVALAAALAPGAARGEDALRFPAPPVYVQECGSCHVPYPARYLSAESWNAVLDGLGAHFGADASLDPTLSEEIRIFLDRAASRRPTAADGRPLLRLTQTRRFRSEHDEVGADLWKRPGVGSPANCGACHPGAQLGDYAEGAIRVPRAGGTR